METAFRRAPDADPIDERLLAAAVRDAVAAAASVEEPSESITAAVRALHDGVGGVLAAVFTLENGRLWMVSQAGYAIVPDGIQVERGIMGRSVRLGRVELVTDLESDADYIEGFPGVGFEAAIPLRVGHSVIGVLNIESRRAFPDGVLDVLAPIVQVLAPKVERLRSVAALDLPGLVRLFVTLGSLRDPAEIAALGAASLARILPVEVAHVWTWDDVGAPVELASWRADHSALSPLSVSELETIRTQVAPSIICQLLDSGAHGRGSTIVWVPLRANGTHIGALVGSTSVQSSLDPASLDTAAVLASHLAVTLDAALSLRRERQSAETDPLTGILNRRGLEDRLERGLADAQERRAALSILVFDCDDFKEINDRAGHQFGDALLREVGEVLVTSVPDGAEVGRLGGDEFVVMLPDADAAAAEELGLHIRSVLAAGLTEAGFPLRLSAGIATYPFDGGGAGGLLRAADQALYAAKYLGKDRVASFREVVHIEQPDPDTSPHPDHGWGRGGRGGGSVLADAIGAANAIEGEETTEGVLDRLCKSLVFVVGATACSASRIVGDYLYDTTEHALRQIWMGDEAAYRISDFPLTADVLRTGEPRAVSFLDDVDSAEAFILRELQMNAVLMLPIHLGGEAWGLIELYEMRLRRFTQDEISISEFLVSQAVRRLEIVASTEPPAREPPVYRLPPSDSGEASRAR